MYLQFGLQHTKIVWRRGSGKRSPRSIVGFKGVVSWQGGERGGDGIREKERTEGKEKDSGGRSKWGLVRHFCTYRPEILHTPRGWKYAKSWSQDFWISSPEKFGAPLNFAFALRPMGRKISNRLYSSFRSSFGLFSGILGWRCVSSFWDLRMWERFLTRFFSIFVCFTLSLIFPVPLKLARYNFHTSCTNEGTN